LSVLDWRDRAVQLRSRLSFAREHLSGDWPPVDEKTLLATLDHWLAPFLDHATGRSDLGRLDVEMVLTAMLTWDQRATLSEQVPAELTTASGRSVRIDYTRDNPTASLRVQDMFGTAVHPTIAGGIPLTLELLSPADRPIQITSDLPGFWSGSWSAVRKQLAGRYPKHHWPTDPLAAAPKRLKERPAD
jgi:ATP-dependent helicase HrpB